MLITTVINTELQYLNILRTGILKYRMLVINQYQWSVITENNISPNPRWVLNTHGVLCRGETARRRHTVQMSLQTLAGRVIPTSIIPAHSPVK